MKDSGPQYFSILRHQLLCLHSDNITGLCDYGRELVILSYINWAVNFTFNKTYFAKDTKTLAELRAGNDIKLFNSLSQQVKKVKLILLIMIS